MQPIHANSRLQDILPVGADQLLQHPLVQRMRHIMQTGPVVAYVPQCTHTRYAHGLGCAVLAWHAARSIQQTQPQLQVTELEMRALVVAALLHDIGHGPFSHTFDRMLASRGENRIGAMCLETHEARGARLWVMHIAPGVAHALCSKAAQKEFVGLVAALICPQQHKWPAPSRSFLGSILSAHDDTHLDIDRIDYLWRDAQHLKALHPPLTADHTEAVRLASSGRIDANGRWVVPAATAGFWLAQRTWYHCQVVAHPDVRAAEDELMQHWDNTLTDEYVRRALVDVDDWTALVDSSAGPPPWVQSMATRCPPGV